MMKFTIFSIFSSILVLFLSLPALDAAPITQLLVRAPPRAGSPPPPAIKTVPSYLTRPGTFYRAVTGKEFDLAKTTYVVGKAPASHSTMAGDLSERGALYVFKDKSDAETWGNAWCKVDPKGLKSWYLVTITYTPNPAFKPTSFLSDNADWKAAVNANYGKGKKTIPTTPTVEGPISVGHGPTLQGYQNEQKQLVWQGAFVGKDGLAMLKVASITEVKLPVKSRKCCETCNIQ